MVERGSDAIRGIYREPEEDILNLSPANDLTRKIYQGQFDRFGVNIVAAKK